MMQEARWRPSGGRLEMSYLGSFFNTQGYSSHVELTRGPKASLAQLSIQEYWDARDE
jgi:hypothetical protein